MPINHELIKRIKADVNGDLHVLVVAKGRTPKGEQAWESVDIKCAVCGKDAHMDAKNVEPARDFPKVCIKCFFTYLSPDDFEKPIVSLVQGQRMTFEEGLDTVKAMLKPTKDPN